MCDLSIIDPLMFGGQSRPKKPPDTRGCSLWHLLASLESRTPGLALLIFNRMSSEEWGSQTRNN